jgi:hypothetical protein
LDTVTEQIIGTTAPEGSVEYRPGGEYPPTEPPSTQAQESKPPLPYRRRWTGRTGSVRGTITVIYDHIQAKRQLAFLQINKALKSRQ